MQILCLRREKNMAYQLTPDLMTGNATIDSEHKQLFAAINSLLDACSKGQGRTQIETTMKFLEDYIERHFSHEEQLQLASGYPDYTRHRNLHEGYKGVVRGVMQELKQTGPTIALLAKVNTNVAGWLITHIRLEDAKVASHIKKSGK